MATTKSSSGFSQMPKMTTTEPTVILKLKKGGSVCKPMKDDKAVGHFIMSKANKGGDNEAAEEGSSPKKPSMSERRKAMAAPMLMSKKGGKVVKKAMGGPMGAPMGAPMGGPMGAPMGGPMGAPPVDPRKLAMMKAMLSKRGAPNAQPMGAPTGAPMGGLPPAMKKGGSAQTKTTVKGNTSKFVNTDMSSADKPNKAGSANGGGIRKGNKGGYKVGGTVTGNIAKFANTDMSSADKPGSKKKCFAEGGQVNAEGKAAAMPKRSASRPVSNTAQSGTFKKGGMVKFADGGLNDTSKGGYDKFYDEQTEENEKDRGSILDAPGKAYAAMKRLLGIKPDAGAGRGNVNPPLARKSGGCAKS